MKLIFAILILSFASLCTAQESTCKDKSYFCSFMTSTCQFMTSSRSLCPRSCGVCIPNCSRVELYSRQKCGTSSTSKDDCIKLGCCWKSTNINSNFLPWCFKPSTGGRNDEE